MTAAGYDPGWLRHRVTIETAETTPDGAGGASVAWTDLATLWAHIEPVKGEERVVADHLSGIVTHRVTLRWRDDITGGMRIAWRGRHLPRARRPRPGRKPPLPARQDGGGGTMSARDITASDLARVLGDVAARAAVDDAVKARAEALAATIDAAGDVDTQVTRAAPGDYRVTVSGPSLFAREFGGRDTPPDPVVAPAVDRLRQGKTP